MSTSKKTVLIVDDDPGHLKIYGWMVRQSGHQFVECLVNRTCPAFDAAWPVNLVLLDYVLHCQVPTPEIARAARANWPQAPVVLLTDRLDLPEDMAPYVDHFVRKGQPSKLVETLNNLLGKSLN